MHPNQPNRPQRPLPSVSSINQITGPQGQAAMDASRRLQSIVGVGAHLPEAFVEPELPKTYWSWNGNGLQPPAPLTMAAVAGQQSGQTVEAHFGGMASTASLNSAQIESNRAPGNSNHKRAREQDSPTQMHPQNRVLRVRASGSHIHDLQMRINRATGLDELAPRMHSRLGRWIRGQSVQWCVSA